MVPQPYTVVNPRAVMVKPLHTLIADRTVLRPLRPNHLALRTQLGRVKL